MVKVNWILLLYLTNWTGSLLVIHNYCCFHTSSLLQPVTLCGCSARLSVTQVHCCRHWEALLSARFMASSHISPGTYHQTAQLFRWAQYRHEHLASLWNIYSAIALELGLVKIQLALATSSHFHILSESRQFFLVHWLSYVEPRLWFFMFNIAASSLRVLAAWMWTCWVWTSGIREQDMRVATNNIQNSHQELYTGFRFALVLCCHLW